MIDPHPTLAEISDALARWTDRPVGLLNGACGAALFYAYYAEHTQQDEHAERVHEIVDDVIAALAAKQVQPAHCGGLAGVAWCLKHLDERGLIDAGGDTLDSIDDVLCRALVHDVEIGARDFLHDGLGAVLYLSERIASPVVRAALATTISELERTAVRDERGTRWIDPKGNFNLGLAHGNPGILALLSHIDLPGASDLRDDVVRWVHTTRFADPAAGSHYPTGVDASGIAVHTDASRLGWCYGDLGIAVALMNAGHTAEAVALLRHVAAHRTPEDGQVVDAALCHGSMGIAQIYRRAHWITGDADLRDIADRWISHGLSLATFPDAPAGFKYCMRSGYEPHHSLLQGVAGIGLALLASIGPSSESAWDRSLLLS